MTTDPTSQVEFDSKNPQPLTLDVQVGERQTSIRVKSDFFNTAPWIIGLLILTPCFLIRPMALGDSAWETTQENILTWTGLILAEIFLILGALRITLKKPDFVMSADGLAFRPSYAFGTVSRFISKDKIEDFEIVCSEDEWYSESFRRWRKTKNYKLIATLKNESTIRWIYSFSDQDQAGFVGQYLKDYYAL